MNEFLQLSTTFAKRDEAAAMARQLVELRLAGCCQIDGPILSIYRWQGNCCEEQEWRLTAKLRASDWEATRAAIRAGHPYTTPQITTVAISAIDADYAAWLRSTTGGSK